MWVCNVMGTVLGPRRETKARTVELELDMEEKEAGNGRVKWETGEGPEVSLWSK